MAPAFDDFAVDEAGDLGHGIVCWTVQFVGLGGCIVILEHVFKSLTDVDCLLAFKVRWIIERGT